MGSTTLTTEELQQMLDRAAERGAQQALASIGLQDKHAQADINDLRNLIDAWRSTRKTMVQTIVKAITMASLFFIAAAVWLKVGSDLSATIETGSK